MEKQVLVIHPDCSLEYIQMYFDKYENGLYEYFNGKVSIIGKIEKENYDYIFLRKLETSINFNNSEIYKSSENCNLHELNNYPIYTLLDFYLGKSQPEYHDEVFGDIVCIKMNNKLEVEDITNRDIIIHPL